MSFTDSITNYLYDVAANFPYILGDQPLDRMVTLYQTQDMNKSLLSYKMNTKESLPSGPIKYISQIRKVEGYKGFLKGFSVSFVGSFISQSKYMKQEQYSSTQELLLVSSLYSIFLSYSDAIYTPYILEFGKKPLQQFKTIFDSIQYMHKQYGFLKIQQKLFPIHFALTLPTFYLTDMFAKDQKNLMNSYFWGATGAAMIIGYGLSTVKTAMLTSMMNNQDSSKAMTFAESTKWIYSTYGLKGFYRGALFYMSFITLGVASWTAICVLYSHLKGTPSTMTKEEK